MNARPMKNSLPGRILRPLLTLLLLLVLPGGVADAQEEQLLEPEKAFAFNAEMTEDGLVEATWEIADDYYMYRDKFAFELAGGEASQVILGEAEFPPAEVKDDPVFGKTEVYHRRVEILIPVQGEPGTAFTLVARGQGCNTPVGVCYPPIKYETKLTLPAGAVAAADPPPREPGAAGQPAPRSTTMEPDRAIDSIADLRNLLGGPGDETGFLDVDQAFRLEVVEQGPDRLSARFRIADGYYLYRDKIKLQAAGAARIAGLELPAGEEKEDEYFGVTEVYKHDVSFPIPLRRTTGDTGTVTIDATYQGCAELGICYPPVKKRITLELPPAVADTGAAGPPAAGGEEPAALRTAAEALTIEEGKPAARNPAAEALTVDEPEGSGHKTLLALLLGAFGAGLLLTFTPCVLPMIPILSSIIVGHGHRLTKARAGGLAFVYVLGTALTYTIAGALAGATGAQLQSYFQNIWAIGILALIFVLMALSMFGLYEIQMPSFVQSRLQERSHKLKGGSIGMVFVLGLISALIVGACVSPVLISFLGIAITKGDPALGGALMFAMAMGMGVPLIALGFGAGHLIPKAGKWMDHVKHVFGVMLLAVAIYLLGVLPEVPVLLLWAALLIVVGIYLGATQSLPEGASGWHYFGKGIGTLLLIWGVLALIGGFYGERNLLSPLPKQLLAPGIAYQAPVGGSAAEPAAERSELFIRVKNVDELDREMARARSEGKYVMLDFFAEWCTDCLRMERTTLADPRVRNWLDRDFISLQVDVTDPKDPDRNALKRRYGVFGPPAVLFFDPEGRQLKDKAFYGYKSADEFLALLDAL